MIAVNQEARLPQFEVAMALLRVSLLPPIRPVSFYRMALAKGSGELPKQATSLSTDFY